MPTRKIADFPKHVTCQHPDHSPPSMAMLDPGMYEHTCPACGHLTKFTVQPRPRYERCDPTDRTWPRPNRDGHFWSVPGRMLPLDR